MISLTAYKIVIWGIFTMGWIGTGIIAVAAIMELYRLFTTPIKPEK